MEIKAEIKFLKNDVFEIKTGAGPAKLYIDKEKENYSPLGSNPLELFLSSLGACVGVYAKRYFSMHAIEFKELEIKAMAEFSQSSPARLVNIKVELHTDADLKDKREVFLRFIHNCPIHNTIVHTKEININIA